ncbi:response regulator transcription factor [Cohnella caldifontis]|uniref:response regulator transcription factor n=1 Tax=Cohnella caldifontis TaxID=3027471 RepID=UPI0023EBAA97|nr:response regulator [Cohnella sp. YIM B05605]
MYSVLLVDDEPRAIESLQFFVDWEGLGYRIGGVCENGEEALDAVRRLAPDVVVTDIRMPVMDGLELIGRLRREAAAVPEFVVLSGYSEFAYAKRAMQLGVQHYLLKPVIGEEASEVFRQIRCQLDARKVPPADGETGSADGGLPVESVRQARRIIETIEALDAENAVRQVRRLFEETGPHTDRQKAMLADYLAIHSMKLLQEIGGEPEDLRSLGLAEPGADAESLARYVGRVIGSARALREFRSGNTLSKVDRYIREFYRSPLSIKQIAASFYVSPVYLGKAYQAKFGLGLLDRIHELRIEEARRLLLTTDLSISAIASQIGYAHYHHFLQHFEKRTGMKPADYRKTLSKTRERGTSSS